MKAALFSAIFLLALGAKAEFSCKLTKEGATVNPDRVFVEDDKLQEFIETMESMGITAKCTRVQDA